MNQKTKQKSGELVYGIHPVIELLKAKRRKVISIYTTKPVPKAWDQIEELLPKYPINIQYVNREVLNNIAGTTDHQSVLAWAHPFPLRKKFFEVEKYPLIVLLDGIQDTRNLGAILRSAYCTGINGIIITKKNTAPINASALKASAGLGEHMDVFVAATAAEAAQLIKKSGYHLYLATFQGKNATEVSYQQPLCLVIGGEGFGISKEILSAGTQITIPQRSKDISYNASVAAGILLFIASQKIGTLS